MSTDIPGPPSYPLIGSLLGIREASAAGKGPAALSYLADKYGPIFAFTRPNGDRTVVAASYELVDQLCDEKRFWKSPPAALRHDDDGPPAGLFTAATDDPNWGIAHRVLMPAFGPLPIQQMFDSMHDLAKQMALSWARKGPDHRID